MPVAWKGIVMLMLVFILLAACIAEETW
jgi:hypothetical protein